MKERSFLHGFSIWDALIITMALKAQCRVLYSEDMQDGRVIDGLRIANPFKPQDGRSGGGVERSETHPTAATPPPVNR